MKRLSLFFYPAIIVAALLFVVSCKKNHDSAINVSSRRMDLLPSNRILPLLQKDLQVIVERLRQTPRAMDAFAYRTRGIGIPYWSKCLLGRRAETIVCLVPLKFNSDSLFQGFIAFELDSTIRLKAFEGRKLAELDRSMGGDQPTPLSVNHALNALNHYGFGEKTYNTTGLAEDDVKKLSAFSTPTKSGTSNREPMWVTSCYNWSTCRGDGYGNCVGEIYYFSECVSTILWVTFDDYGHYHNPPGDDWGNEGGGGGDGGNGNPGPATDLESVNLLPPTTPIVDLPRHLMCFDFINPAKVTIYVNQPTPGTTEPVSILGGIGHAFVGLEQQMDGQTVRRTIGFYPESTVKPIGTRTADGIVGDDAGRWFDIKLDITVSGAQLYALIQAAINHSSVYHIEDYNCVNFVVDVARAADIYIPATKGWWFTGSGLNAGNLGEDIRQMPGSVGAGGWGPVNAGDCR